MRRSWFCVSPPNVFVCGEYGIQQKRRALRSALDASPDFCFECAAVLFKQHLVTTEMDAAYVNMPESLIKNVTQLLSEQLDHTMAARLKNCHIQDWRVRHSRVLTVSGGTGERSPRSNVSLKTVLLSLTFAPSPRRRRGRER